MTKVKLDIEQLKFRDATSQVMYYAVTVIRASLDSTLNTPHPSVPNNLFLYRQLSGADPELVMNSAFQFIAFPNDVQVTESKTYGTPTPRKWSELLPSVDGLGGAFPAEIPASDFVDASNIDKYLKAAAPAVASLNANNVERFYKSCVHVHKTTDIYELERVANDIKSRIMKFVDYYNTGLTYTTMEDPATYPDGWESFSFK